MRAAGHARPLLRVAAALLGLALLAAPAGAEPTAAPATPAPAAFEECPASPDGLAGTECNTPFACSWGNDPRPGCRPRGDCVSGRWRIAAPSCPPSEFGTCSQAADDGANCPNAGEVCRYGNTGCACIARGPSPSEASNRWTCYRVASSPQCPLSLPNLGEPCRIGQPPCRYGSCEDGTAAVIECRGRWVEGRLRCP